MPSEDPLSAAVSGTPSAIVICDEAGCILFGNDALHRLFGYASGELIGASIDALVPEDVPPAHQTLRRGFWQDQEISAISREVEGQRRDGTRFPIDVGLNPLVHQGRPILVASILDTTLLRDLEAKLTGTLDGTVALDRAVTDIAAKLVAVPHDQLDQAIVESQQRLAQLLDVDRSVLWQRQTGRDELRYTHMWRRHEDLPVPLTDTFNADRRFPWLMSQLRQGQTVAIARLDEVPSPTDQASFAEFGARSNVSVPFLLDGELQSVLTFATTDIERTWSEYTLERLNLVATVLANTLARREAQRSLEAALVEVHRLRDQLSLENVQLRREVRTLDGPRMIAGESPAVQLVLAQVEQVAPTTATVLMLGETGCGKEVFAEAIHQSSPRRRKPMVRVNCAAIPTALIESELFGRERGAYTGALSRQIGRFELADDTTIFLDEVGDLPLELQVKLLRVLQDHVIERLGSSQPIHVNVRVIAATHRDLEQAVMDRTFREDLYYRLNVFPIRVPPLRERIEDIPTLVWTFIDEFSRAFGKNVESLSKSSLEALQHYAWPGNVRELRNVIERAVIVATGPRLVVEPPRPNAVVKRKALKFVDVEVDHIRSVLDSTGWRVRGHGGAADLLGIKPTTLESRMAKLGIVRSGAAQAADRPTRRPRRDN
jgi:formate hydrogenlyase transcriptional activator